MYCYNVSFQEFADEIFEEEETYDLIVSNPPFYTDDFETDNEARNKARFTSSLSFDELLKGVSQILSKEGKFEIILPFKEEDDFIKLSEKYNLFLNKVCRIKGNLSSEIKRSLMSFSFVKKSLKEEELTIEISRHEYTEGYINLTKDFYLKM